MTSSARLIVALAAGFAIEAAHALDITVAGLFPNKALVQIDSGSPQTLAVGQKTAEGVTLLAVEADRATFDVAGKRVTIGLGQGRSRVTTSADAASAVLTADTQGHFFAEGQINGSPVRFLVDTGATMIALPAADARRMGIDYRKGERALLNTANGRTQGYRLKLDTVRVGALTLYSVDAVVIEGDGPGHALLGMTFLNRTDMRREGDTMTLTRRY